MAQCSSANQNAPPGSKVTVSMPKTTASRGAIVQKISQTLGVQLDLAGDISDYLQERIEIEGVHDVSYEELLKIVFAKTPLGFELNARQLALPEVTPL